MPEPVAAPSAFPKVDDMVAGLGGEGAVTPTAEPGGGASAPATKAPSTEAPGGNQPGGGAAAPVEGGQTAAGTKTPPAKNPGNVPYARFQAVVKERQEAQKRLADYEKNKERYQQLERMDQVMNDFVAKNPQEWQRMQSLIRGEKVEAQAAAQQELDETGRVSQETLTQMKSIQSRLDAFERQQHQEKQNQAYEAAVNQEIEKAQAEKDAFFADEKNADWKSDKEVLNAAISYAKDSGKSLTEALSFFVERDRRIQKAAEEKALKGLVEKNPKRNNATPPPTGPSGTPAKKKFGDMPFGSEERLDALADEAAVKFG